MDYTGLTPYDIVLENTTRESMAKDNYELGQLSPLDGKAVATAVAPLWALCGRWRRQLKESVLVHVQHLYYTEFPRYNTSLPYLPLSLPVLADPSTPPVLPFLGSVF